VPFPTPLGSSEAFIKRLYAAVGDPSPAAQAALEKKMGFKYRCGVGQLIWPITTCRPDIAHATVKVAQSSACPSETHYLAVRSIFCLLAATVKDGIYFWRMAPVMSLPEDPMPTIVSTPHDIRMANRPVVDPRLVHGYMDSSWADCLQTRRSFGGIMMRFAGGPAAYKASLWATICDSSMEAEFVRAYDGARMSLFLRSVLYDLDIPQDAATTLYEDNEGATTMANAGKPTPRSRHINTNFYAIQEWVECDLVILQRIDTSINLADPLTKSLNRILFHRHRDFNMGFVPPRYSPKYQEVARTFLVDNAGTSGGPNTLAAKAALTVAPWHKVIQSVCI
jgi:hypothetical protein